MYFVGRIGAMRGCLAGALFVWATAGSAGDLQPVTMPQAGVVQVATKRPEPTLGSAAYSALLRQLSAMSPATRLNVLRQRGEAGESAVMLSLLTGEEARLARLALDGGDQATHDTLMGDAARHGLVAYATMRTAAPLCSDPTSPDQYLYELGIELEPILGWLAAQSAEVRGAVTRAALALEPKVNAPGRQDPLLCRRGQHGDRFCPSGKDPATCAENAAGMAEFTASSVLFEHQFRVRQAARREITLLAR